MTLNQRVNWLTGLLTATVIAILATGMTVSSRLAAAQDESRVSTDALRNHLEADMMHDAMRSDVFEAIVASERGDRAGLKAVIAENHEKSEWFLRVMAANQALPLSAEVKGHLDAVQAPLRTYIQDCERLVNSAATGSAIGKVELSRLNDAFETLEKELHSTSDAIEQSVEQNRSHVASLTLLWRTVLGLGGFALLATTALIAYVLRRRIVRPIGKLTANLKSLCAGDMDVDIADRDRADEIGELAQGLVAFRSAVLDAREAEERARVAEAARQRDEAERAEAEARRETEERERRRAELADMATSLEERVLATADLIARASNAMHTTTAALAAGAVQTRDAARTANVASDRSAQGAQVVVTATTQMMAAIEEVAQLTANSANSARIMAEQSMHVGEKVAGLEAAAEQIGAVSKMIADIAAKTNMLALNATIEAARAGTQGQGFAVVANEVKSLAEQIADATRDISGQIDEVRGTVGEVSSAIGNIGRSILNFDQSSTAIATAIDEQGAAIADINRTIQGSVETAEELRATMDTLVGQAESTGAGAADIVGAVKDLERQGSELSGQIRGFIQQVRAA